MVIKADRKTHITRWILVTFKVFLLVYIAIFSANSQGQENGQNQNQNQNQNQVEAPAENQTSDEISDSFKAILQPKLESKLTEIISRFVPKHEFFIDLQVTPKLPERTPEGNGQSQPGLPYFPGASGQTFADLASTPYQKIFEKIESAKLEVYVAKKFKNDAREDLKKIITKTFNLEESESLEISFVDLNLVLEEDDARFRQLEDQVRNARTEADKQKNEATTLQKKLDEQTKKIQTLEKEVSEANEALSEEKQKSSIQKDPMEKYGVAFALIFLGIAAILGAFFLSGSIKKFAPALEASAKSLGDAISAIEFSGSTEAPIEIATPTNALPAGDESKSFESSGGNQNSIQALREISNQIAHDIQGKLKPEHKTPLMQFLFKLLSEGKAGSSKAIALFEIVGEKFAKELFEALSKDQKDQLYSFVSSGMDTQNASEDLLSVAEGIKSLMMLDSFSAKIQSSDGKSNSIGLLISKIKLNEWGVVMQNLSDDSIGRLFTYLTPEKTAAVLNKIGTEKPEIFLKSAKALANLPDYGENRDLDDDLQQELESSLETISEDQFRKFLPYFDQVFSSIDGDLTEGMVSGFMQSNDNAKNYVSENVITLDTLFAIQASLRSLIVDSLSLKDLATLIKKFDEEKAISLKSMMDEQKIELLDFEMQRLESLPGPQLNRQFTAVKQKIIGQIRSYKGSGSLKDLYEKENQDNNEPVEQAAA